MKTKVVDEVETRATTDEVKLQNTAINPNMKILVDVFTQWLTYFLTASNPGANDSDAYGAICRKGDANLIFILYTSNYKSIYTSV